MTRRRAFLILFGVIAVIGMTPGLGLGAEKLRIGILLTSDTALYTQVKDAAVRELEAAGFGQDRVAARASLMEGTG